MILFYDQRGLISLELRLPIAVIDCEPAGKHFVELNEEWYEKPDVPLVGLTDFIDPFFCSNKRYLKGYFESLIREDEQLNGKVVYLCVLKSQIDIMDKRYAEQRK